MSHRETYIHTGGHTYRGTYTQREIYTQKDIRHSYIQVHIQGDIQTIKSIHSWKGEALTVNKAWKHRYNMK